MHLCLGYSRRDASNLPKPILTANMLLPDKRLPTRREFSVSITGNARKIQKVIVDSHYEAKHKNVIHDELILETFPKCLKPQDLASLSLDLRAPK